MKLRFGLQIKSVCGFSFRWYLPFLQTFWFQTISSAFLTSLTEITCWFEAEVKFCWSVFSWYFVFCLIISKTHGWVPHLITNFLKGLKKLNTKMCCLFTCYWLAFSYFSFTVNKQVWFSLPSLCADYTCFLLWPWSGSIRTNNLWKSTLLLFLLTMGWSWSFLLW